MTLDEQLAEQLRGGNLVYRDPALYDDLLGDDPVPDAVAALARRFVAARESSGRVSVLDLGCGTGRVLRELRERHGWWGVGVDVQPALVEAARARAPWLGWVCADVRGLRLNRGVEVVLAVGNTPAYLHTSDDLAALLHTARTHTRPGGLLVLSTLTSPPPTSTAPQRAQVPTRYGSAAVEVTTAWDPEQRLVTTDRTWRFPTHPGHDTGTADADADDGAGAGAGRGGAVVRDRFVRRVWRPEELWCHARAAGFDPLGPGPLDPGWPDPGCGVPGAGPGEGISLAALRA